jgi:hypothetical protein
MLSGMCFTIIWVLLSAAPAQSAASDDVALQAAIRTEVIDGDLAGAMRQYETLTRSADRKVAARALLRLARCYEKKGDRAALQVYQRVAREFPDQPDAIQNAAQRIAMLAGLPKAAPSNGWYNGDWQSGVPGLANWYLTPDEFSRVYDDFVVPQGGWTVTAVYSNQRMDFSGVTVASWEIRSGVAPGRGGTLIASGTQDATQTAIPGNGPFERDPMIGYRVQVDGLHVQLPEGRYWLSVAPVGMGKSYLSATLGKNAFGVPPGNNGGAFYTSPGFNILFREAEEIGKGGQLGIGKDFSQGVIIATSAK